MLALAVTGKLSGRVAVVTGGASGIGESISKLFANEGATVVIMDRDIERARALAATIKAVALECDVSDESDVKRAFESARDKAGGHVEILVNNAGINTASELCDMPTDLWDDMIRTNLRSVFLCTREVLPAMKEKRYGRVINLASQLGHKGAPELVHYCAAKAGVLGFTRALAYEVAAFNITVNAIAPGPVDTPLLRGLPQAWLDMKFQELPIGRPATPDEIAPTALLLASEIDGAYYLGASMNINGGDYMF